MQFILYMEGKEHGRSFCSSQVRSASKTRNLTNNLYDTQMELEVYHNQESWSTQYTSASSVPRSYTNETNGAAGVP